MCICLPTLLACKVCDGMYVHMYVCMCTKAKHLSRASSTSGVGWKKIHLPQRKKWKWKWKVSLQNTYTRTRTLFSQVTNWTYEATTAATTLFSNYINTKPNEKKKRGSEKSLIIFSVSLRKWNIGLFLLLLILAIAKIGVEEIVFENFDTRSEWRKGGRILSIEVVKWDFVF